MKKKVLCLTYGILVSTLLLTGCKPLSRENTIGEDIITEWKKLSPDELDRHVTAELSDSYQIDADIMLSKELKSYEVAKIEVSRNILEEVDGVLKNWLEYCGVDTLGTVVVEEREEPLENGVNMKMAHVDFGEDNNSWIQVRSAYATMFTPFSENYRAWGLQRMFHRQLLWRPHHEILERETEAELICDDRINEIQNQIEKIFQVSFMDCKVYTCTLERLQEVLEWELKYDQDTGMNKNEDERWEVTTEDEGCILCFRQGYEGIPLYYDSPSSNTTGGIWTVNNYCMVTLSKENVEGLEFVNPYEIKGECEKVKILSFGEFIEKHMIARKGIDTKVVNVGLYYLPIYTGNELDFVAKPIWCVQTEEEGMAGYPVRNTTIYDAVTGEEIQW
jgi:hypothetical protein